MKATYNPWPGLAAYQDPSTTNEEHRLKFCGRQSETYDLLQLIENRSVTTLYGSTGIGKTSLLRAGVFPILKQRRDYRSSANIPSRFFPIYVRLCAPQQLEDDRSINLGRLSFAEILEKCIEHDLEHVDTSAKVPPGVDEKLSRLWFYFHTHQFSLKGDQTMAVTPVIVLDQFEEVFATGDQEGQAKIFLQQLHMLAEDRLPWREHKGYHAACFRFVLSLREDRFFFMEDYVDTLRLALLKDNRYRLQPLKDEQARQVITIPGRGLINPADEDDIVRLITEQARNKTNGYINTLMLSLICSLLYEKSGSDHYFNVEKVKEQSHKVLRDFYSDVTRQLPLTERKQMEELLVKDGRRDTVRIDTFKKKVPHGEYLLAQKENSILSSNGQTVEVIHDQLAELMEVMKSVTRLEIYRQRLKRISSFALFLLSIFLVLTLTWQLPRLLWRDTIPLKDVSNTIIDGKGYARPLSVPTGVLRLVYNVNVKYHAFQGNPDIRELHIGDSCYIDYHAFAECPNLHTIYFDGKNIQLNANAFSGCTQVETIYVSDSCSFSKFGEQDGFPALTRIVLSGNNPNFTVFGTTLLVKQMDGQKPYWKFICSTAKKKWFHYGDGSSALHNSGMVILPQMEDSIALGNMQAEYGRICDLSKGQKPDTLTYSFITCSSLSDYTNPVNITDNPKVVGIDLPYVVHIKKDAFRQNPQLLFVQLPQVYDVGDGAFEKCEELSNVYLPKTSKIGNHAFDWCTKLTELQLPYLEEADSFTFFHCDMLRKINAPKIKIIRTGAFASSGLQDVTFPAVEEVEYGAFDHCQQLRRLILPSLKRIDEDFYECDSLREIVVPIGIAEELVSELNKKYEQGSYGWKYFSIAEKRGQQAVLRADTIPMTTYVAKDDTLKLTPLKHQLANKCNKLFLSKKVKAIVSDGWIDDFAHREMKVELGNPVFFSFRNGIYSKKGFQLNAEDVEHAYIFNYGDYKHGANFTHKLKTIYLHYPQGDFQCNVWHSFSDNEGAGYVQIDSAYMKTVTLLVPYGSKKYCETKTQLFGQIEEISLWETLLINVEWYLTNSIWRLSNAGTTRAVFYMVLAVVLLLTFIAGYVLLFWRKPVTALALLVAQLVSMLFFAVLLYNIGLNYREASDISLSITSLLVVEILLLLTPWFWLFSHKELRKKIYS